MTPGSDDEARDSLGTNTLSFVSAGRAITIDLGLVAGQRQVVDVARNTVSLRGVFHHVNGSLFADDLTGNEHANRLEGGGGDDTLDGGGGDRSLHGQSNGRAPDRRSGGGCDGDTLVGQAGHDWLDGGRGRDRIDGGDGDDVLVGDPARDTLSGGAGANREIRVSKNSARCSASGGGGARSRSGRGVAVPGNGAPSPVHFDPISRVLQVQGDADGPRDDVILVSIRGEEVSRRQPVAVIINGIVHSSQRGSGHFDAALAGATARTVRAIHVQGLDGDDQLTIQGVFRNANGRVTLDGGSGSDVIQGGGLSDVLVGADGDDWLFGAGGRDSVSGGVGNDTLAGGRGDDTLGGGPGQDVLDGGRGINTLTEGFEPSGNIAFDPSTGRLTITGDADGPRDDVIAISVSESGFVQATINGEVRSGDPAAHDFDQALGGAVASSVHTLSVQGLKGNDVLSLVGAFPEAGRVGEITLDGGPGDDIVRGGPNLNLWQDATNGAIRFVQDGSALARDVIVIGRGDLAALGGQSGAGGSGGRGGYAAFDHDATTHSIVEGAAWLDSQDTWDTTIGNENPDEGLDWFTVAVQEIGHALGLHHLDDLGGLNMMGGIYTDEQTAMSTNDNRHIRTVYGGNLEIDARPSQHGDGVADTFRVVRTGNILDILVNDDVAFHGDLRPVGTITITGSADDDTLTLDYSGGAIGRSISFNAGAGTDTIVATANANHTLSNGNYSNSLNDTVTITSIERATLQGGNGDSSFALANWSGAATLSGGAGNDSYLFNTNNPSGTISIDESAGDLDTIDFSATTTRTITINLGNAGAQTVNANLVLTLSAGNTIENLVGGLLGDSLTGNGLVNSIVGHQGNDIVDGGTGDDRLEGGAGNDNTTGGPGVSEDRG